MHALLQRKGSQADRRAHPTWGAQRFLVEPIRQRLDALARRYLLRLARSKTTATTSGIGKPSSSSRRRCRRRRRGLAVLPLLLMRANAPCSCAAGARSGGRDLVFA